jgi:thymidine kinase
MKTLQLILGPMKSGKTEELERRMHRFDIAKMPYTLVIPDMPIRKRDAEIGLWGAKSMQPTTGIEGNVELLNFSIPLFIDEGQFFDSLLWVLPFENVTIAALNGTAEQKMWPSIAEIIPWCTERPHLLKAVCDYCGNDRATLSYYPGGKDKDIVVGDAEYKAVCRECLEKIQRGEMKV